MDNIKEIKKMEKDINKIEEKINLFFKLMKEGIKSAKDSGKDEIPLVYIDEERKELTLYDDIKDTVYVVPLECLFSLKFIPPKGYLIDLPNLLTEYIKKSVKLLHKIDEMKGDKIK